ncbi:palmitoyl-protein thioesterase [Clonorchis sinensis]|uniref:Palmitoyl-protein thioesterase n=1 Tax=Clonorchis sinensis TaxID=79923 RepID=G7YFU5_CLOSI|nr:palmitoyl-protein thioesterase [Clonorchis sinensis]
MESGLRKRSQNLVQQTYLENRLTKSDGMLPTNIRVRCYVEWFGYFDDMSLDKFHGLKETEMYKKDWLGLKRLDESGRLHFLEPYSKKRMKVDGDWTYYSPQILIRAIWVETDNKNVNDID